MNGCDDGWENERDDDLDDERHRHDAVAKFRSGVIADIENERRCFLAAQMSLVVAAAAALGLGHHGATLILAGLSIGCGSCVLIGSWVIRLMGG